MNRFFEKVTIEKNDDGFVVLLDGKLIKSPMQKKLNIPTEALAKAIKIEWEAQTDKIIPSSMPLFQLMNTVVDKMDNPEEFINQVLEYSKSELICYFAEENNDVYPIEKEKWQPLLDWVKEKYEINLKTTNGINFVEQDKDTLDKFDKLIRNYNKYEFTALQAAVPILGSIVIPIAILENHISIKQGFELSFLDELYQMKQWGNDVDKEKAHKKIISELTEIYKFNRLSK